MLERLFQSIKNIDIITQTKYVQFYLESGSQGSKKEREISSLDLKVHRKIDWSFWLQYHKQVLSDDKKLNSPEDNKNSFIWIL